MVLSHCIWCQSKVEKLLKKNDQNIDSRSLTLTKIDCDVRSLRPNSAFTTTKVIMMSVKLLYISLLNQSMFKQTTALCAPTLFSPA